MSSLVWAILLLIAGIVIVVLEVFLPSGGVLAFLATAALVGAVVLAFMNGPATGLTFVIVTLVALPSAVAMAFRWWPKTPMGRRMLLRAPEGTEVLPDDPRREQLKHLIGRVGRAKCPMLPSGMVVIDGQTVDATSEGMAIEEGQLVQIVKVRGTRVVVRPADDAEPIEDDLARPIDAVIPDPFDEQSA